MTMERCPISNADCKYFGRRVLINGEENGCFSDEHHLYHPSAAYKASYEKKFRELPANKVVVCRRIHDELHAVLGAPEKPKRQDMFHALGGISIESDYTERVQQIIEQESGCEAPVLHRTE